MISTRLIIILLALVAATATWIYGQAVQPEQPEPLAKRPDASPLGRITPFPDKPTAITDSQAPVNVSNAMQKTHDLRQIYEQFRDSKNPQERNMAYRAWSACFPVFIAPQGGMVPIDSIIAALPTQDNGARSAAYRDIWGRCKSFSDLPRQKLLAETQFQKDAWMSGRAHAPGDSAAKSHMAGEAAEALVIARAAIATQDPYAIDSLREFVIHYWWDHNDRYPDDPVNRPDLRALAFSVAACQMGLECGATSFTAVQQCANTGACTGSTVDRFMQNLPTQADRDTLLEESRKVREAIRIQDFKALGLP
jgi:hypothetical protein